MAQGSIHSWLFSVIAKIGFEFKSHKSIFSDFKFVAVLLVKSDEFTKSNRRNSIM